MASVGLDVAPRGIDERFDTVCEGYAAEQAREFQGAVELVESSGEELVSLRALRGVEDLLGLSRKRIEDVIEVVLHHGVISWCGLSAVHLRTLWAAPSQHRAQPCQGWPLRPFTEPLTRRAR